MKGRLNFPVLFLLSLLMALETILGMPGDLKLRAAADFTHGLTVDSTTQGTLWFNPGWSSAWVDVHYRLNQGELQNFRMTQNGSQWRQVIVGLQTGTTVDYFFTYEQAGLAYDSPYYQAVFGSVTPTPLPTVTVTPPGNGDYTQGFRPDGSTQGTLWFNPGWSSAGVDVHYWINRGCQQNFHMVFSNGQWQQAVPGLRAGVSLIYLFTYEQDGQTYDSPFYEIVFNSGNVTPTPIPTSVPTPVACGQIPGAGSALPGQGCYATQLPAGQKSVSYLQAVENADYRPALAKTTGEYSGPYQTNDWWSSLLWDWNQGAVSSPPGEPYSQNLHPHPFSMQAESDGLRLAYVREVVETAHEVGYVLAGSEHLRVTLEGLNSSDTRVAGYSDWLVTAQWESPTRTLKTTFGHGLPYVFFTRSGTGNFKVKLVAVPLNVVNNGEVFVFTASNNIGSRYALFGPAGSVWNWAPGSLEAELIAPEGKNYLSVAALPTLDDSRLEFFRRHAYNFVTATRADWNYDPLTGKVRTTFVVTTEAKEMGGTLSPLPLLALYRHQWINLSTGAPAFTGDTYTTARGEMKVIEAGGFTTDIAFNGVLPSLPAVGSYDPAMLRTYIHDVYTSTDNYGGGRDTYGEGKNLNRIAQLVHLADQQGMTTERDSYLAFLKATLADWFDGRYPYVFYYDSAWNTMQGYPTSFGADTQLNDHHFHWGYFIMAAATVAQYDPAWARHYEGSVEWLIRDVANWERTDPRFPYLRNFDPYAGHSWASGHQAFGAGNNQESSSESLNFAAGLILWGSAVDNQEIRDLGVYLYSTEVQAVEQYWLDVDNVVFPSQFTKDVAGILWGQGEAHATWWSGNPEEIHGINILPVTGGSLYLGRRTDEIDRNIASLSTEPGHLGLWQDLLWEYEALSNPASALARWTANPSYIAQGGQEAGETQAHTYHWLHALDALGRLNTQVTADLPTYAVFEKDGALTCVAYNPGEAARVVTFSNGVSLPVPARKMVVTAPGGCHP